jgi:TonB family protein
LDSFALPAEWFQQTFGAASDQWLQQYKTEFDYFEFSESRRIQTQAENSATVMQVNIVAARGLPYHQAKPAPTSLQPLPASEEIQTRILGRQGGRPRGSWANTFVYLDGRFRFFGVGGLPFWDPARVRRSDMCDPEGGQPGHLVDSVMPLYPEDARKQGTQGTVRLLMNVAKDGSVSSVEVVRGDPMFVESAKLGAKQWHYQPFVNCGQPMEGQDFENIHYALDNGNAHVTLDRPPKRVRISSGVAASNVVHKVNPEYPVDARRAGIDGTVVMKVVIDKEGVPQEVTVVSGPLSLADEAVKTVKQWRYKPYILNGEPVEVETTVQMNFTLNER